jgi:transposase
MQPVYARCCGLDVHKKLIVACLQNGKKTELREFKTLTSGIKELAEWLLENKCQMTAMESTGVYWKPVYNILELYGIPVMVVNAHHMKNVPGRKTDAKDAQWLAQLTQNGLLRASYIPDKEQRELRDIVRYRKSLTEERSREINRLEKTLEGANIKLSSLVSSLTGLSSRRLLDKAMTDEGVTEDNISLLLHTSMLNKKYDILLAMEGFLSPVQRQLVRAILDHIDDMTERIGEMTDIIKGQMQKYEEEIDSLDEITGIGQTSAEIIIAEIGIDMSRFPTAAHLCSWAGLSPGNNESAGKRKSGRTTKGNKTLKSTLIQCAQSAVKNKDSFFYAQYQRLVVRRGSNRAKVAVAHSMLIAIYYMLKNKVPFQDLGSDYYLKFNAQHKVNYYLNKLTELGVEFLPAPSVT